MTDRDREMTRVLSKGTNLIEATDPKDRPTEAVDKLRDLAEWLCDDGHRDIALALVEQADCIVERYGL